MKKRVLLIGNEPRDMIRLRRTYGSLKEIGVDVKVFNPYRKPSGQPRIIKGAIRYLVITLQVLLTRADIYHFFNVPDIIGLPLIAKRGVVVYDVRSPWSGAIKETFGIAPLAKIAGLMERLMTRTADYVVAVNRPLAERARLFGGKRILISPNYPLPDFGPSRSRKEMREMLGLGSSPTVLYLGKITKVEGVSLLMNVIRKTCKTHPSVKFLIVGGGPQVGVFKKFVSDEELEANIVMTGWVPHSEVADYINAVDLCLLPRQWDSYSNYIGPDSVWKAGEYLALGKPVVAPKMGGFATAKFPVIPADPSEMADAVISFISEPTKKPVGERPSWRISHERLKRLYTLLGATGG
ncbi:MAG: glycosyltransferase [Candidatus Thorarchaeota archaeon]